MLQDTQIAKIKAAIAANLQQRRTAMNLSKNALAQKAGISVQSVTFIEDGVNSPSLSTFLRICDALETSPDSVLRDALENAG